MTQRRADRLAAGAIWLLILGLSVAVSPTPTDPFAPLRLACLGMGIAAGLLAAPHGRLPGLTGWTLVIAATVFAIAALAGTTGFLSVMGRYPRYEGLPMMAAYGSALLVGARLLATGASRNRRTALKALSAGCLANAATAAVQAMTATDTRVVGLLGNATLLGTFCLIGLCVLGWQLAERFELLLLAGTVAAGLGLVLSASRGALLGAGVAAAAALLVRLFSNRRPAWWWFPVAGGTVALVAVVLPGPAARLAGTTPFAEATVGGRLLLWQESWQLFGSAPWLGAGPGRFVDSIGAFHSQAWAAQVGPYAPPDSPHNLGLQVLVSTGVLGLIAVLAIAGSIGWQFWLRRPWDGWQAGTLLAAVAVTTSYLTSFSDPVTLAVLLLLVGGAIAGPAGQRSRPGRVGLIAAAAVALGLGVYLGGSALVTEARYSAALTVRPDATAALLEVPRARPWDADLARRVGYTAARLAEQGNADPAQFLVPLSATCASLPGSVECLQAFADLQDLSGQHAEALATLQLALAAEPTNVDTVLRQGIANAELRHYEQAEERFRYAATLRPTAAEPWDDLAELFSRTNRADEAAQARARAEEIRRR
ncbi:MAG: O-antigen ligase family protein [Propionibacteriaceae bacterium]|nr:O-antigen ligase family protein [Propionibacteriaceae bacterium]